MVHCSGVLIVVFEQVNIGWGVSGSFQKPESRKNLEKSLTIQKAFKNTQVVRGRPLDCTRIKAICHPNNQSTIRIWYFLWLILLFDTQLRHVLQSYTNKSFSSSSFSSLPMKVCESEVYNKHCSALGHALHIAWVLICL